MSIKTAIKPTDKVGKVLVNSIYGLPEVEMLYFSIIYRINFKLPVKYIMIKGLECNLNVRYRQKRNRVELTHQPTSEPWRTSLPGP
jgi:hypothetical protein